MLALRLKAVNLYTEGLELETYRIRDMLKQIEKVVAMYTMND